MTLTISNAYPAARERRTRATPGAIGGPVAPSVSTLRPLSLDEISVTGGFWGDYQRLNATVIIDHCLEWMERIGWIRNFDLAARNELGEEHAGIEFVDSEIYKLLEAMAWELGRTNDPDLQEKYTALVARVGAAQETDGYLHTSFGRAGQRPRFSDLEWGHELYCFGHLIQAAVARLRTGHDDELPAIARRAADHLYEEFGPTGRAAVCGHPEIEPALAELYRATGDARYLELATLFVERRGKGTLAAIDYGPEYFQDDVPVRDADVLRGHAVRALYLAAGALDVAVESDDAALAEAVGTQWANTVARRTYLTGGMGAHHREEAFGADYELPSDRAYSETCAGIASVMLSWRLLLDSGDSKYADLIERTLLNNILASPREDGRAFYYTNTLQQRVEGTIASEHAVSSRALASLRAPWFEVSCCPTNVSRMIASAALYFATASENGLQLHQYGTFAIDTVIGDASVKVRVETGYPFDGDVRVTFDSDIPSDFALSLRVPAWAVGTATVEADGETLVADTAVHHVTGPFAAGDSVLLRLPLRPRFTHPAPRIDAVRGQVAVERGPLVLAVESVDLPGGLDTEHIVLDESVPPRTTANGARVALKRRPSATDWLEWPYAEESTSDSADTFEANFIPYYAWANRGPSTMRVWVPTAE